MGPFRRDFGFRARWTAWTLVAAILLASQACGDRPGAETRSPARKPPASDDLPGERTSESAGRVTGAAPEVQPVEAPEDCVSCRVVRVVDGDTIKVEIDGKVESVRYIGIDTPETVHPNKPTQPFGPEASAFNKEILDSGEVLLSFDLEERDHFGRRLAYVYTVYENRRVFVNLELVRAGLARAREYPPNVTYAEIFRKAEAQAREAGLGIWSESRESGR
ncbi:MAG: thermonuclease family protein [Planctomycetes bacterium]|nr:thermonuclease family protein [Planctomycetota bacterium]